MRWKFLLPHGIPSADSLGAVVLSYAANNVLPARLGELVRAQAIGRKCEISRSLALDSIFVKSLHKFDCEKKLRFKKAIA